ncbi:ABC transporter permease [Demequina aestuarii]|uniref:ABC transporter permease n=1 Tax=Demequina aestuarii TaxID=327095 RepID=UPI000783C917|nr:ABC transporter permease [Demequina aestuarii]
MSSTDLDAYAREHGLERVGARPPFTEYVAELWRRRAFAFTMARYKVQASMSDNRLGMGWIVLKPILNAALFGLIFGVIMPSDSRPENFIPFLVSGVFIFEYFSKSFGSGARAIIGNSSLVRSLSFPRMLLPISSVLQQVVELVPMLIVMGAILLFFGEPLTWGWLMIVPIMALMTLFNLGVALISARLTVHMRDVTQFIPLITRVLFYSSGIFYSLELVLKDDPELLRLAQLNPVHDYIALVRGYMVEGNVVSPLIWWVATGAAFVTFAIGVVYFWRAEERYGRD